MQSSRREPPLNKQCRECEAILAAPVLRFAQVKRPAIDGIGYQHTS